MSEAATVSATETVNTAAVTATTLDSDVACRIREIVSDSLDVKPEEVTPEASFVEDLGADSLDIVDLAIRFEGAFALSIKDRDYLYLTRLCDATSYIEARLSGATTGPSATTNTTDTADMSDMSDKTEPQAPASKASLSTANVEQSAASAGE